MLKNKGGDAMSRQIVKALQDIKKELKATNKYLKELVETKPDTLLDPESVMIDTTEIHKILNKESIGIQTNKIDGYNV